MYRQGMLLAIIAFLLVTAVRGVAAPQTAVVDLEKVFKNYYRTRIIEQDFAEQSKVYRNYIARQAENLRKGETEFRQKRDAALNIAIAPEERQKRQDELKKLERDLKKRRAELEQYASERAKALQKSASEERRKVITEIQAEVHRRAVIEGYLLVLDKSAKSVNDTAVVLYNTDTLDITDKVITELNRGAKAPAAKKE